MNNNRIVVGSSGASGTVIAIRLLRQPDASKHVSVARIRANFVFSGIVVTRGTTEPCRCEDPLTPNPLQISCLQASPLSIQGANWLRQTGRSGAQPSILIIKIIKVKM
jgi:hypothetical protein